MAAEIDYFGIKERIVTILKDDTTNLFAATPSDKTKFRLIEAGAPHLNKPIQGPFPRIFVTNDDVIDEITQKGSTVVREPKIKEHSMRYLIIAVNDGKDGPDAEEKADDFVKLIIEKLELHNDLSKPADNTDPLADWSMPETVTVLNRDLVGSNIAGRVIRLRIKSTTG